MTGYLRDKELTLRKVLFLPAQGRLITLSIHMGGPGATGNVLHFWEIEDNKVEKVAFNDPIIRGYLLKNNFNIGFQIKTTLLDSINSEVTTLTIDINRNVLMMGTKGTVVSEIHIPLPLEQRS